MRILALIHSSGIEKQTAYIEVIKTLVEKNIKVDIVVANQNENYIYENYYLDQDNIRLYILQNAKEKRSEIKRSIRKVLNRNKCTKMLYGFFFPLYKICCFQLKKRNICKNRKNIYDFFLSQSEKEYQISERYDYIWAQDAYGLLWADWINERCKIKSKIVYHCLELYWEHYLRQNKKHWRSSIEYCLYEAAKKVLLSVDLVLIQDEARWKVLCHYTGLPLDFEKVIFPVSINDYDQCIQGEGFSRLNIDKNKKIIFYPTYFAPERGCLELSEIAKGLNDEYIVVMHGFIAAGGYVDKIRKKSKNSNQIVISNEEVEYQDLLNIHRDIWCTFLYYGENNNNDKYIVNSSNKLAMSLQAGKPIITIGNKMLDGLCRDYKIGVVLKKWTQQEFCDAVVEIQNNYDFYCNNAKKCYKKRYDTSLYKEALYTKLLGHSKGDKDGRENNR